MSRRLNDRITSAVKHAESSWQRWMIGTVLTGIGLAFAAARFA